ncbi:transcriptional regulator NrdR [Stomatohabitans albus]|uniref:transcriptional regulator NrdR n=1 Tax=Stomatohabitans albus TaxID=3110766 RepID=UPI00300CF862
MRCPYCNGPSNRVIDSRTHANDTAIRRRRACDGCGQRFTTSERVEYANLIVHKRNGTTQAFDPEQIRSGMAKACTELELDDDHLRMATGKVVAKVRSAHRQSVTSAEIGDYVLEALREISPVAWLRFASVYQKFTSTQDFQRALAELTPEQHLQTNDVQP